MIGRKVKFWRVRAFTDIDRKHCFSECTVRAYHREDAIQAARNRVFEIKSPDGSIDARACIISDSKWWHGKSWDVMTASSIASTKLSMT